MEANSRAAAMTALAALTAVCLGPRPARAQILISANDGKQAIVNGEQVVPPHPAPDSVSLFDTAGGRLKLIAQIDAPTSVIGPPGSVAITPDRAYAIVTAARRLAPDDPSKIVPDDKVSLIDLKGHPPRVVQTVHAGPGAGSVAINSAGSLVLVSNRDGGTVSVFALHNGQLEPRGEVKVGDVKSGLSGVVFFDGGRRALVARTGDDRVSVLDVDGDQVTLSRQAIAAGLRPYQIAVNGDEAVVGAIGGNARDVDTISLVDLHGPAPRAIDTVAVGLTPEGVALSPDGRYVAVQANGGMAPATPRYSHGGLLEVWRVADGRLQKVADAPIGGWTQGVAWTSPHTIVVQAMVEKELELFDFDGAHLRRTGVMPMPTGPAGIATAP